MVQRTPFLWHDVNQCYDIPELLHDLPEIVPQKKTFFSDKNDTKLTDGLSTISKKVSIYTKPIGVCQKAVSFAARIHDKIKQNKGISLAPRNDITEEEAEKTLIRSSQQEYYGDTIEYLKREQHLPKKHPLAQLSPFLDHDNILRVGGRLKQSELQFHQKFPIILSSKSDLTTLIFRFHHEKVYHQGRVITQGALNEAGFFIQHGSKVIKNFVRNCVVCSKLRGKFLDQLMNDLPPDRLEMTAPFTNSGMDVFGPYLITDGISTRRSSSTKKCWVLLFTCLVSRAVHLEPLPALDITAFKNAFRRFTCMRGQCKMLRSDRGTNFVGAYNQDSTPDIEKLKSELKKQLYGTSTHQKLLILVVSSKEK